MNDLLGVLLFGGLMVWIATSEAKLANPVLFHCLDLPVTVLWLAVSGFVLSGVCIIGTIIVMILCGKSQTRDLSGLEVADMAMNIHHTPGFGHAVYGRGFGRERTQALNVQGLRDAIAQRDYPRLLFFVLCVCSLAGIFASMGLLAGVLIRRRFLYVCLAGSAIVVSMAVRTAVQAVGHSPETALIQK